MTLFCLSVCLNFSVLGIGRETEREKEAQLAVVVSNYLWCVPQGSFLSEAMLLHTFEAQLSGRTLSTHTPFLKQNSISPSKSTL